MAWRLILRVGETDTYDVELTALPCMVTEYPLASPTLNQEAIMSMGDGNSLSIPTFANVTESVDVHIGGPGYAALDVQETIQSIERVVDVARQGSIGYLVDKVYLLIKFDHDTLWWRSQILAAQWSGPGAVGQIWKNYTTGTIALTRRYYWETEVMQSVAVSSGTTTTPTTGYATVYNADDTHATQRNWFQIAADQVIGSLPAPAKISIKNTSGSLRGANAFYLGNYVFNDPTTVDPIYRGEDASFSDTTADASETLIYRWSLASSGLVDDFRGQFGRFVVVWSNRPAITTLVRAAVNVINVVDLALGEMMLDSTEDYVQDLGALPIPPSQYYNGMGKDLSLVLNAKAASGTDTLGVDWLQIFPSGSGRFRLIQAVVSAQLAANEEVIDDGPERTVYYLDSSAAKIPLYRPLYEPIHLWPGAVNRIRMLVSSGSFAFEPAEQWGVSVSYRGRRLTL